MDNRTIVIITPFEDVIIQVTPFEDFVVIVPGEGDDGGFDYEFNFPFE
jgi:hypothetical protein